MKKLLPLLFTCALPLSAQAAETGDLVQFISCPVYRDTDSGRKSGCWLADDHATGIRYDVSESPYKPDWNYEILVEGRVSDVPETACGAKVLNAVRTSRLDTACPRHMLPAEGFPGRRFVLPRRNIDPLFVARKTPPGPYTERVFPIFFEFDRDFLAYQYGDWLIDNAVTWIRAAKPKKLIITGFAATEPATISGRKIAERPEVAKTRADVISESLRRLIPGLPLETRWQTKSKPIDDAEADGIPSQSQRRVEIRALF